MIRRRLRRRRAGDTGPAAGGYIEIDAGELSGIFSVPGWLRDIGLMSWLLVGIAVFLAGAVWLLSLTQVIVVPVIAAGIVAAVGSPVIAWLQRRGIPRGLGAAALLLAIVALGVGVMLVIVGGITAETSAISSHLTGARETVTGWIEDLGVEPASAERADRDASSATAAGVSALLDGLLGGVAKLSSIVFFCAMTALSLFFLLKDGPAIRAWSERHLGLPDAVARSITRRVLGALRGYFLGVTIVAAYNAAIVAAGALVLGVPLVGTLAAVTFLGAYVPYIGAWAAGGFAVLIALGGAGTDAAAGMIVVQLLANGLLQQLVQPLAMGAALGIHPLAVLIVTIAGGALFGAVGLILAAPLVSATVRISADLARARAELESSAGESPGAPAPAAAGT